MKNNNTLKQILFLSLSIFLIILNISSVHSVPLQNNKITESDSTIIDRIQKDSTILKILFEFIALSDSCGFDTNEYPYLSILEKNDSLSSYWEIEALHSLEFAAEYSNFKKYFLYCGEINNSFILYVSNIDVVGINDIPDIRTGHTIGYIKQKERLQPIYNMLVEKLKNTDNDDSDFIKLSNLITEIERFSPLCGPINWYVKPKMYIYFDDKGEIEKILHYGYSNCSGIMNFKNFIKQLKGDEHAYGLVLNIDSFPTLKKYN